MTFDWAYVVAIAPPLLRALQVTVGATVAGTVLALVLGLAWTLMRRSRTRFVSTPASWLVEFVRSTPLLVQLYFLFYVAPAAGVVLSPLTAGILALGLHYSSYTSEVYRAGIEAVPRGQWEAAIALDFSRLRTWRTIILPQAIPPIVPALGNYVVAMFKDTPMLAAITVMELLQTAKIIGSESFRYLEPLTLVGVLFLGVSLVAARLVHRLERWGQRYA